MAITTKELAELFLESTRQRRSANTLRFYSGRLTAFIKMFGDRPFAELTQLDIERYLMLVNVWPDGRPKAPDTIRANAISLEQLQAYAVKNKVLEQPIFRDLEKPVGRQRDRLPTAEEVEKIKAHCSPSFLLIYQSLRQCGARPNELARAMFGDWDQTRNLIVLLSHKTAKKTGRPRKIAVGSKMRKLIEQSLGDRGLITDGQDPPTLKREPTTHLFVSPHGKPWSTESLSTTFRRARDHAGLDKQIVLYSARHEHATEVYKKKGLLAAAEALGHTSTNMTQRYAHTTPAELCDNQDAVDL